MGESNLQKLLHNKPEATIIVTDSGLGGVSVAAELYKHLKEISSFKKVTLIFFNALFDENSGYNRLKSRKQKIEIFDAALSGMLKYAPDIILIACNTLSVLYPYTAFSQSTNLPVRGIVEIGANYILEKIQSAQNACVIIFATPTTIQQHTHKKLLSQYFPDLCIIEQACPKLIGAIEDGEQKAITHLIHEYTRQALQTLQRKNFNIYGSLNCTHFGYYQDQFLEAFRQNGIHHVEILDPNSEMVKALFPEQTGRAFSHSEVSIEFVSKIRINRKGIESLIPFLVPVSEEVIFAFRNYRYEPELF